VRWQVTEPGDLIVVGASAGGVEALRDFVGGLPADLPAAVLAVLHLPSGGVSALGAILDRSGPLPAVSATHGAPLEAGHIYTAVADHHLMVVDSRIALTRGPTENGHRPAVDVLFRSAAVNWGPRATGVVLSGALDDGTAGLAAIKAGGGLAIVQDPDEALYRSMPDSARALVAVDQVLRAGDMGAALAKYLRERTVVPAPHSSRLVEFETRIGAGDITETGAEGMADTVESSGLSCPDCNGVLFTVEPDRRFRCRVGHGWTAKALLDQQGMELEKALWTAYRALEEKRALAERMRADAARHGQDKVAERYDQHVIEVADAAEVLRRLLFVDQAPGRLQRGR
jgi:two-component system, chemotaxis family, protein-glutamate methylesterase/glutaminase